LTNGPFEAIFQDVRESLEFGLSRRFVNTISLFNCTNEVKGLMILNAET
jgi:hypothetical protein